MALGREVKTEIPDYSKTTMLEALGDAFAKYQGQQPMMKVSDATVLVRTENDAIASFTKNFYEKRAFLGDALDQPKMRNHSRISVSLFPPMAPSLGSFDHGS